MPRPPTISKRKNLELDEDLQRAYYRIFYERSGTDPDFPATLSEFLEQAGWALLKEKYPDALKAAPGRPRTTPRKPPRKTSPK